MKSLSLLSESTKPVSCGVLMHYTNEKDTYFLLVHPGGPYYEGRDLGVWSIPKGINDSSQSDLEAAKREVQEETGIVSKDGEFVDLGTLEKPRKKYHMFGLEVSESVYNKYKVESIPPSNTFELEGNEYPEVDKIAFFDTEFALKKADAVATHFIEKVLDET
jgi:predicted NUDIX family NTP pyrophosphohydrolase